MQASAHSDPGRQRLSPGRPVAGTELSGVWPALLTMFDSTGDLDLDATAAHAEWLIANGVHGLVVGGTSGEFVALDPAERRLLVEAVVAAAAARVPVLAGTGAYSTAGTVALTRHAEAAGADAALVVLPYYQRPSRREILAHYEAVAAATDLPIWVYNIPANAAVPALSVDDLAHLYAAGVAQGVKSTLPTVHQVLELTAATDPGFRVFYGGFTAPLEAIAGGAHGWISGILNVVPAGAVRLWDAMGDSDLPGARSEWTSLLPYRRLVTDPAIAGVSDLAVYRGLLRIWGRPAGHCRPPLRDLEPAELAVIENLLDHRERTTT